MECSNPGVISDEELLAYLAGEPIRPAAHRHLSRCEACSARLAEYRRMELALTSTLYRWDCPSSQVLGEFELGLLSPEVMEAVEAHVRFCRPCISELAALNSFLATEDVAQAAPASVPVQAIAPVRPNHNHRSQESGNVLGRLQDLAKTGARRIAASLVLPQPRLAFQRDLAPVSTWPRNYAAENLSISLHMEATGYPRQALKLIGFVKQLGQEHHLEELEGVPVLLSAPDQTVLSQQIDDLGNFVFGPIAPAVYNLELRFPEQTVAIEKISLVFPE